MSNGEKAPPQAVEAALLEKVRDIKAQQILILHTIRDAVILAGEQVQNKRIDFLEEPPDFDLGAFFMDILISLAVTPVAGLAIRAFAMRFGTALKASKLYELDDKVYKLKRFSSLADQLAEAQQLLRSKDINAVLRPDTDESNFFKSFAALFLGTATGIPAEIVKQQAKAARAKRNLFRGGMGDGDTAGVAISRAVLHYVRLQERATTRIFEAYETMVTLPDLSQEEKNRLSEWVKNTYERIKPQTAEPDLEIIEHELSRFFEACIWIKHFGGSVTTTKTRPPSAGGGHPDFRPVTGYILPGTELKDEFKKLTSYWVKRFIDPNDANTQGYSFLTFAALRRKEIEESEAKTGEPKASNGALIDAAKSLDGWFARLSVQIAMKEKAFNEELMKFNVLAEPKEEKSESAQKK